MQILRTILTIIFAIDCIALTVVVLMQEGKAAGTGRNNFQEPQIHTGEETRDVPWKADLLRATTIMAVLFFILAAVLNMNF